MLNFPTSREPLREWTKKSIDPAVMIAAIEAVMQIARSQPDFEEQRLARKTAVRFVYLKGTEGHEDPSGKVSRGGHGVHGGKTPEIHTEVAKVTNEI